MVAVSIMMGFESLGADGEFGRLQSALGFEPPGALRFCNTPLEGLIAALETGFAALAEPGAVTIEADADGAIGHVSIPAYGFRYEAALPLGGADRRRLLAIEERRVRLLFGKLGEVLRGGGRTLVRKGDEATDPAARARLLAAIRRFGSCPLLMVSTGEFAGSVRVEPNGLLIGQVSFFAPADQDSDAEGWASVCAMAARAVEARIEPGMLLGAPSSRARAVPYDSTRVAEPATEPVLAPVVPVDESGPVAPMIAADMDPASLAAPAPGAASEPPPPVAADRPDQAEAAPGPLPATPVASERAERRLPETAPIVDDSLVPASMLGVAHRRDVVAREQTSPSAPAGTETPGRGPVSMRGRLPPLQPQPQPPAPPSTFAMTDEEPHLMAVPLPGAPPPLTAAPAAMALSEPVAPPPQDAPPRLVAPLPVSAPPPMVSSPASAPANVLPPAGTPADAMRPRRDAPVEAVLPRSLPERLAADRQVEPALAPAARSHNAQSSSARAMTALREEDLPDLLRVSGLVLAYRAIRPEWSPRRP